MPPVRGGIAYHDAIKGLGEAQNGLVLILRPELLPQPFVAYFLAGIWGTGGVEDSSLDCTEPIDQDVDFKKSSFFTS